MGLAAGAPLPGPVLSCALCPQHAIAMVISILLLVPVRLGHRRLGADRCCVQEYETAEGLVTHA